MTDLTVAHIIAITFATLSLVILVVVYLCFLLFQQFSRAQDPSAFFVEDKKKTIHKTWEAVEQKDAMCIKMEMPGVSKEDVTVYLDGFHLLIKGETKPDPADLEGDKKSTPKIYYARISMITLMKKLNTYKTREIQAEMKDGVLKVKIPRIEESERDDIANIKVD